MRASYALLLIIDIICGSLNMSFDVLVCLMIPLKFVSEENTSSVNNALGIPGAYPLLLMAILNQFQSKTLHFSYFAQSINCGYSLEMRRF